MHKLLKDKHFVDTAASLIKFLAAIVVLTGLYFYVSPEQHSGILTAILMIVGGGPIRAKLGI